MGVDLLTATSPHLRVAMTTFLQTYQDQFDMGSSFRSGEVGDMLATLMKFIERGDGDEAPPPSSDVVMALRCIKLLTRARVELESLIDDQNISRLLDLALAGDDFSQDSTTNESLRIIINLCIIHQEEVILVLHRRRVHAGLLSLVGRVPPSPATDDVLFAGSRLLFYVSIDDDIQSDLRDRLDAVAIISDKVIERVQADPPLGDSSPPIMYQSISELLHVLFSLGSNTRSTNDCQETWRSLTPSLLTLLMGDGADLMSLSHDELMALPSSPRYVLMLDAVHLLICLDDDAHRPFMEKSVVRRILTLLEIQSRYNCRNQSMTDRAVIPVLTVLERMCAASPDVAAQAKKYIFGAEFAQDRSLKYRFESGDTTLSVAAAAKESQVPAPLDKILRKLITTFNRALSSIVIAINLLTITLLKPRPLSYALTLCLCGLSYWPWPSLQLNVNHAVSSFLFAVCDRNPDEYVRVVGFGNAIGLLTALKAPGFQIPTGQQ